jgi:hypothetical protein
MAPKATYPRRANSWAIWKNRLREGMRPFAVLGVVLTTAILIMFGSDANALRALILPSAFTYALSIGLYVGHGRLMRRVRERRETSRDTSPFP